MNSEMMEALENIQREKGISIEVMLEALANALLTAYKRMPDAAEEALVGLLDDPGDELAFLARVLLVLRFPLDVADALQDDLLGRLRGDAPEVVRGVVPFADDLPLLVKLLRDDVDVAGLDVDLDERLLRGVRHPLVGGDERVGERLEHHLDGDALLALDVLERLHHV